MPGWLTLLLFLAFPLSDSSVADLIITGRVTGRASSAPIAGAQVIVSGTRTGAITQGDGTYRLRVSDAMRGREVRMQAQSIGYGSVERLVRLSSDTTVVDFVLTQSPVALHEMTVTGKSVVGSRATYAVPSAAPMPQYRHREFNTESYARISENGFRSARAEPLSTFSIDVDRASYSNVRRFIREGKQAPKDAVRIEEMINYFPYSYPEPKGRHPFSVTTEVASAPWQPEHRLVRIGLQTRKVATSDLPPSNIVFLIDVSGSMQSPKKLPLLKQSLRLLVNELRPVDRVAMVVYAGSAGLVLPSTSGAEKERILDVLESLEAGGSTAGGAGIRLAYEVARSNHIAKGNNRVILATDGDFNVGVSSDAEMVRLIEQKREQGTFLTVLGFGMGNLKDSKLEQIADHGNGNFAYIDDILEARKVLLEEMGGTLLTVAKDVKIQVEFNPAKVRGYRLIGYENRLLANEDFDNDRKDAGEIGAGHSVTALYEVIPVGATTPTIVRELSDLRYQERAGSNGTATDELLYVKVRYKQPDAKESTLLEHVVREGNTPPSADLRFAASVAAFGMLLRQSEHRGNSSFQLVLDLARGATGTDPNGYRREFVRLVETARTLDKVAVDRER